MYNNPHQYLDKQDHIGSFSGYIRRSQASMAGLVAQFFGENGEDADTITALSLSKFQDAQVFITVYLIKDALGKIMKDNGHYPKIASFYGVIKRPTPKRDGMIAQFFAPNGSDADEVNNLNKSCYLDCLVYVDIKGKRLAEEEKIKEFNTDVDNLIDVGHVDKATEAQRKEYHKKEKNYRKNNEILKLSGFLRNIDVLSKIGKSHEYKNWLMENKQCCFPIVDAKCDNEPIELYEIKGLIKAYNFLPFCSEHYELIKDGNYETLPSGITYLEMKQIQFVQEWAWTNLQQKFSLTGKEEPDPSKIIQWAIENELVNQLPSKYRNLI